MCPFLGKYSYENPKKKLQQEQIFIKPAVKNKNNNLSFKYSFNVNPIVIPKSFPTPASSLYHLIQSQLDDFWDQVITRGKASQNYKHYIGYLHEMYGYDVEYNILPNRVNDGEIDLICRKQGEKTLLIMYWLSFLFVLTIG